MRYATSTTQQAAALRQHKHSRALASSAPPLCTRPHLNHLREKRILSCRKTRPKLLSGTHSVMAHCPLESSYPQKPGAIYKVLSNIWTRLRGTDCTAHCGANQCAAYSACTAPHAGPATDINNTFRSRATTCRLKPIPCLLSQRPHIPCNGADNIRATCGRLRLHNYCHPGPRPREPRASRHPRNAAQRPCGAPARGRPPELRTRRATRSLQAGFRAARARGRHLNEQQPRGRHQTPLRRNLGVGQRMCLQGPLSLVGIPRRHSQARGLRARQPRAWQPREHSQVALLQGPPLRAQSPRAHSRTTPFRQTCLQSSSARSRNPAGRPRGCRRCRWRQAPRLCL